MKIARVLKKGACTFGALLLAATSAFAQSPDKNALEDVNAHPLTIGSFKAQPKLFLQQSYNDNIFAAESGKEGDFITTVSPYLHVEKRFGRHLAEFTGKYDVYKYARNGAENVQGYNANLKGTLEGYHSLLFPFSFTYLQDYKARNQERRIMASRSAKPTAFNRLVAEGGAVWQPNRFKTEIMLRHEARRYDNGLSTTGTRIVNEDSDFNQNEVEATLSYVTPRLWEPFISLLVGKTNFLRGTFDGSGFNGLSRDSRNVRALAGLKFDYKGLFIGKIAAGHFWKNYNDSAIKDTDSTSLDSSLVWNATERARFTAGLTRKAIEDNDIAQGLVQTMGSLDLDYELQSDLFLKATNSLTFEKFTPGARKDTILENGLGLYYVINPHFQLGGTVTRRSRDSSDSGLGYDQNIFMLRLDSAL